MTRIILILIWIATVFDIEAQDKRILIIRDSQTQEPVIGATITIANRPGGLLSDTLGRVDLQLSQAEHNPLLHIRGIGYKNWSGNLSDAIDKSVIQLEPYDHALSTVVVSATMKEVSKDASPIPVEVYTPKFFQKNASPTIFEALTVVNGVRPQLNCNVCNTGDIHINGMEGPYTMVTIDGMPIVSGLSSVYGLFGIPNGLIERVEVVKGPASTLYGSEAVGGMINVITKNASTAPRVFVDAFATHIGEYNLDASAAYRFKNVHSLLGINYFNFQNSIDINDDNFTDITLQKRVSVFNKWNFQRKNDYFASLAARYVHENRWGGELQWEPRWRGTDSIYGESIYTNRVEFLGRYQLPVAQRRIMFDGSWNLHDQNSVYGNLPFLGRQQVAFGQLSTDLPWGKRHDALLGTAIRYTWYDDNTSATAAIDSKGSRPSEIWLPGIFLQDEVWVSPRNRLLLGLRYDYNSAHGNIFTPRVSWKWANDAQQQILRLTAGSGYRVANIFTEDHAALTGAREVVITENLLPERSWNANLNYVRKFFPRKSGFIGLDASLFYTYFSNQILPDYLTDPNKIIYDNLDGYAVSTGASVQLDANFRNGLKIIAGATLMDVFRKENGQRTPQLFAPPLSGTWTISYPISAWGLSIDYTGNLNSPMHLPVFPNDYRPATSPWFALHNIQVSWRTKMPGEPEIYLGVKNLFGFYPKEDVIMRSFDPFDKQILVDNPNGYSFDPSYNYAPIQQQRILLGLRCSWK